jgi:hypothetical protein
MIVMMKTKTATRELILGQKSYRWPMGGFSATVAEGTRREKDKPCERFKAWLLHPYACPSITSDDFLQSHRLRNSLVGKTFSCAPRSSNAVFHAHVRSLSSPLDTPASTLQTYRPIMLRNFQLWKLPAVAR